MTDKNDREFLDLLNEEESSLDIGSGSPRVRYSKPQERKELTFEERVHDARFEIIGVGDMPKGEFAHCAFCGCRLIHFVLLKRLTDNTTWKVGNTCIGRVGLTLPKSVKKVVIVRDIKKYKRVEEQPKVEKPKVEETHPGTIKFLEEQRKKEDEEFAKEINELVKVEKKPEKKEEVTPEDIQDIFDD